MSTSWIWSRPKRNSTTSPGGPETTTGSAPEESTASAPVSVRRIRNGPPTRWAISRPEPRPSFRLGEGIAGRVARDLLPVLVNDAERHENFVPRDNPVARILCVPLTHFDRERSATVLYGVLNATRRPGSSPFTDDDLEYLTRFAGQLSIPVANSMLFQAERERSEQLALVNTLIREIAGNLSRERILETAAHRIHEAFAYPLVKIGAPFRDSGELRVAVAASRETVWAALCRNFVSAFCLCSALRS